MTQQVGAYGIAGYLVLRTPLGIGLRILSTRSAFGNVIHADLAFPVQTGPGIESVQFLFKTRTSF